MDKKTQRGLLGLVALFAFFIIFRVLYQKGARLLADMYPWNWVALAIILILLGIYAYRVTRRGKSSEDDE